MKKKVYKQQRKRCQKLFDAWIKRLGLKWYNVSITYYRDTDQFVADNRGEASDVMAVYAHWEYMTAYIYVNVPAVLQLDDSDLENAVVHELVHILTIEFTGNGDSISDEKRAHVEHVVTLLTKAFVWVRKGV